VVSRRPAARRRHRWFGPTGDADPRVAAVRASVVTTNTGFTRRRLSGNHLRPKGFRPQRQADQRIRLHDLAEDLHALINALELDDVALVGFSMGGGEVARYISSFGDERLHSAVFASAVTPFILQTSDNPLGPLTKKDATQAAAFLVKDEDAFYDEQITEFFSVNGELKVSEAQHQKVVALCKRASKEASLACMAAWSSTDFRDDLA
jgi:pimeloyl-ACP methyl ester carboxylesterase